MRILKNIVLDETRAQGADSIVEYSGAGGAVSTGLKLVKKLGQYVQVGILGKPIISHMLPLSRWKDSFDLLERKQALKILLCYDE